MSRVSSSFDIAVRNKNRQTTDENSTNLCNFKMFKDHAKKNSFQYIRSGCRQVFKPLSNLSTHQSFHSDVLFKCEETGCTKVFPTKKKLKAHIIYRSFRPFRCPEINCGKSFPSSCSLKVHVRIHTGEKPFVCSVGSCKRAFNQIGNFMNHKNNLKLHKKLEIQKKKEIMDTKEDVYRCSDSCCGKVFYKSLEPRVHVNKMYMKEKPFECSDGGCKEAFKTFSELKNHRNLHHGLLLVKQERCSKVSTKNPFSRQLHKCPEKNCGKIFASSTNLKSHKFVHTGERPHVCKFDGCTRSFTLQGNLKRHMKNVHKEPRFVIPVKTEKMTKVNSVKQESPIENVVPQASEIDLPSVETSRKTNNLNMKDSAQNITSSLNSSLPDDIFNFIESMNKDFEIFPQTTDKYPTLPELRDSVCFKSSISDPLDVPGTSLEAEEVPNIFNPQEEILLKDLNMSAKITESSLEKNPFFSHSNDCNISSPVGSQTSSYQVCSPPFTENTVFTDNEKTEEANYESGNIFNDQSENADYTKTEQVTPSLICTTPSAPEPPYATECFPMINTLPNPFFNYVAPQPCFPPLNTHFDENQFLFNNDQITQSYHDMLPVVFIPVIVPVFVPYFPY